MDRVIVSRVIPTVFTLFVGLLPRDQSLGIEQTDFDMSPQLKSMEYTSVEDFELFFTGAFDLKLVKLLCPRSARAASGIFEGCAIRYLRI